MPYAGIPPFYPPGWFWLGGRAAALTGTPGWEMFKPWAITSIAVAVVVAFALWAALIRFETALAVAAATAAVTLAYSSPEPYAAIVTVMIPPVLVLAWSGLRSRGRAGRAAVGGKGVFLGVTAMLYTLLCYNKEDVVWSWSKEEDDADEEHRRQEARSQRLAEDEDSDGHGGDGQNACAHPQAIDEERAGDDGQEDHHAAQVEVDRKSVV